MIKKLRKSLFILSIMTIMSVSAMAGIIVTPADLPKQAADFIKSTFASDSIVYVERNRKDFEVALSSGTEIEFFLNGDWKEIKAYSPIPASVLPANIMSAITAKYPQAQMIEISKKYTGYEISLNNGMEVYVSSDGQILGEKFD